MIPDIFQIVITGLMIVIPIAVIYKKAGLSPFWSTFVFLPGFGLLVILLQLAFSPWRNCIDNKGEQ
jgi:NADH:ubiquinone oxidoreductase subunit 3 (subunit A)